MMPVAIESSPVTDEILRTLLPSNSTKALVAETRDTLNKLILNEDAEFRDTLRDNILGYAEVVKSGRYKIDDYLNAVRYVSWRIAGNTKKAAYIKTFPDRYERLVQAGRTNKEISAYVAAYSGNKLVVTIETQALIPTYIANADIFQQAINAQVKIMRSAASDMVRMQAADSLMKHLKQPDTAKVALDIKVTQDTDVMEELRRVTFELRESQKMDIIEGNATAIDVAHKRIVPKVEQDD